MHKPIWTEELTRPYKKSDATPVMTLMIENETPKFFVHMLVSPEIKAKNRR